MKYDPKIHHRRSIRLKGYDYSQAGLYFITLCAQNMKCWFGEVINGEMILNDFGIAAYNQWVKLTERFLNFELDVFQIMPNHMHGIILLTDSIVVKEDINDSKILDKTIDKTIETPVGATLAVAPQAPQATQRTPQGVPQEVPQGAGASPAPAVGDIVGAYKSLTALECLEIFKQQYPGKRMGKLWQRNYFERIIRDDQAYHNISNYIINNPANWNGDKFYLK